jgi:extradiol dioxygenase family protein|tara:strand:- start:51 stop:446 length:396 start_codon:yes stop_codon:yes gene_type:complete
MSNPFHLAIPAGNLSIAAKFYENILGCKLGNREEGKWIDVDFWGNELTLHKTDTKLPRERHDVDMGSVSVPHFGVHLEKNIFEKIKENLKANNIKYLDEPYTRFKDKEEEQQTFFIEDPHGNVLELKTLTK